ncbi:glycosyl hydrolase family 18 protein [Cellvibrio sp. pealriver]|uniref:glycosyl hydrolase family 18 protein n=1 Tax=Cellvibrio sp. pealriver TaxID=1622269 RepID=UPI00069EA715|nr:glycosyl hydrolase family 18 protein [Cellvibrio sp. pealriver]
MKGIGLIAVTMFLGVVSFNAHAVSCENVPQWNSSSVYTSGMQAQEAQKLYKANWWSQGHNPANYSGQWQEWSYLGDCDPAGNRPPVAVLTVSQSSSSGFSSYPVNYTYTFNGSGSYDLDGDALTYSFDGTNFSTNPVKTISFGQFYDLCEARYTTVTLTVKDSNGATSTASQTVRVGDPAPGNPRCSSSVSSYSSVSSTSSSVRSVSSRSTSSLGLDPCIHPAYVAGSTYSQNSIVTNAGNAYRCDVPGWCSSTATWAYAPGTGAHWQMAWTPMAVCSGGSSSVASTSSSRSSVSSGSSSSVAPVNNGLPKHALVGYWHNFNNGSGVIRLADVDAVWDVIVIAFADDVGNGTVAFNLDPVLNKAQFIADVAAKRAQGKKVVLSFGGEKGTVTLNNATNVTNFVNSTAAIINEYGFDGIDIDLESGANVSWGAPVINNMVTAVKQLKQQFPNMYLSMAPEHPYVHGGMIAATGIWGAYLPIIDGLRNDLDLLHVQLYNNGSLATPYSNQPLQAGTVDFMVASVKMLVEGFPVANNTQFVGLRPDQVALGVPSGSRSAGSGFVTIANLNAAVNCLVKLQGCGSIKPNQAYPDFRGVMTWSINWDVADGRPFSIPVNANLDALPK